MKTLTALSAIIALADAHAIWQQLWKNGEDLAGSCARTPQNNNPVPDYTSNALQCNVKTSPAKGKCTFAAGDVVTVEMHQHNSRDCADEAIGGAHWGPVLVYMSKVDDSATADGSGEFFKVYENSWKKLSASSSGDKDYWGTKDINWNCGKLSFHMPTNIAGGEYLLRAEAIALHGASASGGAQHYVTCYQITLTSSGTAVPKGVKFPGAYTATGPGLGFSIYSNLQSGYPVPGPPLIDGGTKAIPELQAFGKITTVPEPEGGSNSTSDASSSSSSGAGAGSVSAADTAAPADPPPNQQSPSPANAPNTGAKQPAGNTPPLSTLSTSTRPGATPAPPPTGSDSRTGTGTGTGTGSGAGAGGGGGAGAATASSSGSGTLKEYSQCGGSGFTGTAQCAAGLVCNQNNQYYSQCVKAGTGSTTSSRFKMGKRASHRGSFIANRVRSIVDAIR